MTRIWLIVLAFTGCQYFSFDVGRLSNIAPTPTSLFVGDTCAPPCWFGLTAGESNASEVLAVLESHADLVYWNTNFHSNVFDPQSGVLIDGGYFVQWRHYERWVPYTPHKRLVIRAGVLTDIEQIAAVDEDICLSPCRPGLVAGETTISEVLAVLESHDNVRYWADGFDNVFDTQSGLMIDGDYLVQWLPVDRYLLEHFPESRSVVREGVLRSMAIYIPEIVSVEDVLAKLGQPDLIRFGFEFYREPIVTFEYHTIPVRVFFTGERATCESMIGLVDKVWVDRVDYLPPDAPAAIIWRESIPGSDPIVPYETWQQWRRNEVEAIPCHEMVRQHLATAAP